MDAPRENKSDDEKEILKDQVKSMIHGLEDAVESLKESSSAGNFLCMMISLAA